MDIERATMLLESARCQARRFKLERDIERVAGERERVEAAYGRALLRMLEQLRRLRRAAAAGRLPVGDMGRDAQAAAIRLELHEALAEPHGSEAEAREIIDVLSTVLQLYIGAGNDDAMLLADIGEGAERLCSRLDLVDAGLTWSEAKAAKARKSVEMDEAVIELFAATTADEQTVAREHVRRLLSEVSP